jgi:hypothetical protein
VVSIALTIAIFGVMPESEHSKRSATEAISKQDQWRISILSTDFEKAMRVMHLEFICNRIKYNYSVNRIHWRRQDASSMDQ